jgi:hypothetical protein
MDSNTLIELTALSITRPAPGASAETMAAWYEAQSRQYEHDSLRAGPDGARDSAQAARAHQRSLQWLRDSVRANPSEESPSQAP